MEKELIMDEVVQSIVIILHYGDPGLTFKCISSVLKGSCQPDIILIDNDFENRFLPFLLDSCKKKITTGPYSISSSWILQNDTCKEHFTNHGYPLLSDYRSFTVHGLPCTIHYFKMAVNTGFSKGANRGIKAALDFGKKLVLLVNNDTEVSYNSLEAIIKESFSSLGIKGAIEMESGKRGEKTSNLIFAGGDVVWKEVPVHLKIIPDSWETPYETDFVRGSCMAIPEEVIKKVGFFDERFFAYMEDVDYCLRALNMGYDLKIVPKAVVWHRVAAGTDPYTRNFLMAANYVKLLFKHAKGENFFRGMILGFVSGVFSLVNKKRDGKFKGFVRGLWKCHFNRLFFSVLFCWFC